MKIYLSSVIWDSPLVATFSSNYDTLCFDDLSINGEYAGLEFQVQDGVVIDTKEPGAHTAKSNEEILIQYDSIPECTKLVVGFDANFPPFGFVAPDGSYDGFDLALRKRSATGWAGRSSASPSAGA